MKAIDVNCLLTNLALSLVFRRLVSPCKSASTCKTWNCNLKVISGRLSEQKPTKKLKQQPISSDDSDSELDVRGARMVSYTRSVMELVPGENLFTQVGVRSRDA